MARRLDVDAVSADHERNRLGRVDRRTKHHQGGEWRNKQLHLMSLGHVRKTRPAAAPLDVM